MLLKYFYDKALAHASYMVGCQKTNSAMIIDAGRNIEQYLEAAAGEGMKITGVAETHIHADFVAGTRELAERAGAKIFVSDEGPAEWKYEYAKNYEHQLLTEGDNFYVGQVKLSAIHTPGHTPEHLSFMLTDAGGGASEPMGLFTGDFVFVNALGRPDLLQSAAGQAGNAEESARALFQSAKKFKQLAGHLQIWPAHGAGSSCGKGLGSIPSSTVGYELANNPALQFENEHDFVEYILDDQPETPDYFGLMKRVNKTGPALLSDYPVGRLLGVNQLKPLIKSDQLIIDTRDRKLFADGHVPGTILIECDQLGEWAGWFVDYDSPVYLIVEKHKRENAIDVLRKIGVDTIKGFFDPRAIAEAGLNTQSFTNRKPEEVADDVANGKYRFIDVRSKSEWNEGHVPQAEHWFLGKLDEKVGSMETDQPILTQCGSGVRSSIAASILQANGIETVINLDGGMNAWKAADLPVEKETAAVG